MGRTFLAALFALGAACSDSSSAPNDGGDPGDPIVPTGDYACVRVLDGASGGQSLLARSAIASSGDLVVLGGVSGSVDFGGGAVDGSQNLHPFIAKYGPDCAYKWVQIPDPGASGKLATTQYYPIRVAANDNIYAVVSFTGTVTLGGTTLTSSSGGDFLLLQVSSSGALMAARQLGGPAGVLADLAIDANGDLLLTGWTAQSANLGSGTLNGPAGINFFVAKYSAAGSPLWSHIYGTPGDDYVSQIATDKDGNVFIIGWLAQGSADLGGGAFTVADSKAGEWFVAKYGSDGSYKWARHFTSPNSYAGMLGMATTPDGSVLVTGGVTTSTDFGGGAKDPALAVVLIKYSATGDYLLERRFPVSGNNNYAVTRQLVTDPSGNITLIGLTQDAQVDFGAATKAADVFVVKLRPDFSALWQQRIAGPPQSDSLVSGSRGEIAVVGGFSRTLDVSGHAFSSANSAGYLARFLP